VDTQFARAVHERVLNTLHLLALGQAGGALIDRTLAWLQADGSDSVHPTDEVVPTEVDVVDVGFADLIRGAVLRSGVDDLVVQAVPTEMAAATNDSHVASTVMDAVVEALRNAQRHARADRIEIHLDHRQGRDWIEVRDDGQGFDDGATSRLGLRMAIEAGMSEIGGTATVSSQAGVGTKVILGLPLRSDIRRRTAHPGRLAGRWPQVSRGCRQLLGRIARGDLPISSAEAVEAARIEDGRIRAWLDCTRVDSWLAEQVYGCVSAAADCHRSIRLAVAGEVGISAPLEVDLRPILASAAAFTITVRAEAEELHVLVDRSAQTCGSTPSATENDNGIWGLPEQLSVEEHPGPNGQIHLIIRR
jgi:hypothetical protein